MAVEGRVSGILLSVYIIQATNHCLRGVSGGAATQTRVIAEVEAEKVDQGAPGVCVDDIDRVAEAATLQVINQGDRAWIEAAGLRGHLDQDLIGHGRRDEISRTVCLVARALHGDVVKERRLGSNAVDLAN